MSDGSLNTRSLVPNLTITHYQSNPSSVGAWRRLVACATLFVWASPLALAQVERITVPDVFIEGTMEISINDLLSSTPRGPSGTHQVPYKSWTCEGGSLVIFTTPPIGPNKNTQGRKLNGSTLASVWPDGGLFQTMKLEEEQYFLTLIEDPRNLDMLDMSMHPLVLQIFVRNSFERAGGELPEGAQVNTLSSGSRMIAWEEVAGGGGNTTVEFEVELSKGLVTSYSLTHNSQMVRTLFSELSSTSGNWGIPEVPSRVEFLSYHPARDGGTTPVVAYRVTHTINTVQRLPPGSTFQAIVDRETAGMRVIPPGLSEEVVKWRAKYDSDPGASSGPLASLVSTPRRKATAGIGVGVLLIASGMWFARRRAAPGAAKAKKSR